MGFSSSLSQDLRLAHLKKPELKLMNVSLPLSLSLPLSASGIKEALQVAKTTVAKQTRRDFDDDEGGGGGSGSSSSKPTRGMGAMGKIVSSETTARKQAEDRERFGDPSKVVLLEQMVGSSEEVDEGLSEDVGEECGKQ